MVGAVAIPRPMLLDDNTRPVVPLDLPIVMPVAFVPPINNALPLVESSDGDCNPVSALPVPDIQKFELVCNDVLFCIKLVAVGARMLASQVLIIPVLLQSRVVLVELCGVTLVVPLMVVVPAPVVSNVIRSVVPAAF